jgi:DNA-binding beta-propeller fold protein YncE
MIRIVSALLWLTVAAGCAGKQQQAARPLPDGPGWPDSGEPVRIRFVGSVTKPEDLDIAQGLLSRIWDAVVGNQQRRLLNPMGVAVDGSGVLYVVDAAQKNIKIYDRKEQTYRILPDDDELFQAPIYPLADDEIKRLYVTDAAAGLVRALPLASGSAPAELGKGQLERPTGIALNRQSNELLVLDTRQGVVFRYDRKSLALKGRFGEPGAGQGQFNRPTDLTVNGFGEILVCDALNFRVQVFSPDGLFRRAFGQAGDSPGSFSRPKGIAVDSDNNVYVLDNLFDNVQIFSREGLLLLAFGRHGQNAGEFWMPSGIHIDRTDRIYVADTYNKRVQIFQYLKQTVKQ